jgi:hypothetical protein
MHVFTKLYVTSSLFFSQAGKNGNGNGNNNVVCQVNYPSDIVPLAEIIPLITPVIVKFVCIGILILALNIFYSLLPGER